MTPGPNDDPGRDDPFGPDIDPTQDANPFNFGDDPESDPEPEPEADADAAEDEAESAPGTDTDTDTDTDAIGNGIDPSNMLSDDPIDRAMFQLRLADGEEEEREAASELLRLAAEEDENTQRSAVELVAAKSRITEDEAEEMLGEQQAAHARDIITIHEIVAIHPHGDDEDVRFEIDLTVDDQQGTLSLTSGQLMSPASFKKQVFELTYRMIDIQGDWEETVTDWMREAARNGNITERTEHPLSNEHTVAEKVISAVSSMQIVTDYQEFKQRREGMIYYDPDDFGGRGVIKVASRVIEDAKDAVSGEIKMNRLSNILGDFLIDSSEPVSYDGDQFRAWRFDPAMLCEYSSLGDEFDIMVEEGELDADQHPLPEGGTTDDDADADDALGDPEPDATETGTEGDR